jgi:hypothetical protein
MANASLIGKADATLVSAAFREGQSKMPADLGGVYATRAKNIKDFSEGIKTAFENTNAEDKAFMDSINEQCAAIGDSWIESPNVNDHMLNLHTSAVQGLKSESKDAKTDIEKMKIGAEMNKYASSVKNNSKIFGNLLTYGANHALLSKSGSDEAKLLDFMLKDYINNTSITNPEYVDGDIVYTLPGTDVKMSLSELDKKIGKINNAPLIATQEALNSLKTDSKSSKRIWDSNYQRDFKQKLNKIMVNSNDILNVAYEAFEGMEDSPQNILTGNVREDFKNDAMDILYTALEQIGGDYDGDGIKGTDEDKKFYTTSSNGEELIKRIMEDDSLYREVVSTIITNEAGNSAYKIGEGDRPTKSGRGKDKDKDKGDIYGKPFYSHAEVKDIGIDSETSGNFIQLDPNTREAVYRSVVDRSKTFKGTMGYYALVTGKGKDGVVRNGYVRYKSRAEYLEDLKDKTLDASSTPYADRFVTFDRLLEIEGASKGGSVSKVKSRI